MQRLHGGREWHMEKAQRRKVGGVRRHGPCSTLRTVSQYSVLLRPLKRCESVRRIFFMHFNDYMCKEWLEWESSVDPGTQGSREEAVIDLINRGDFQDMAGLGEWEIMATKE